MFKKNEIRLPSGIASVAHSRHESGLLAILLFLKSLYAGGIIINYKQRYTDLSNQCDCDRKTLKLYISVLLQKNLVREVNDHLELCSKF